MESARHQQLFEASRPQLLGVAYRMLGSFTDAQDAVQETYLKWHQADITQITNPAGWLTTCCTRLCLDQLKSAQHNRMHYVGPWLPEPVRSSHLKQTDDPITLAETLSTAFLLLLERMNPRERAAYLLREIFSHDYAEVAKILDVSEATCRQLVSRARKHVQAADKHHRVPVDKRQQYV
ncbi:MAG: hypothetical protein CMJ19_01455 [Phycisphaeraceae bacterium]|nr:hypothetical protein [Phycisphaeraceae bacterium]